MSSSSDYYQSSSSSSPSSGTSGSSTSSNSTSSGSSSSSSQSSNSLSSGSSSSSSKHYMEDSLHLIIPSVTIERFDEYSGGGITIDVDMLCKTTQYYPGPHIVPMVKHAHDGMGTCPLFQPGFPPLPMIPNTGNPMGYYLGKTKNENNGEYYHVSIVLLYSLSGSAIYGTDYELITPYYDSKRNIGLVDGVTLLKYSGTGTGYYYTTALNLNRLSSWHPFDVTVEFDFKMGLIYYNTSAGSSSYGGSGAPLTNQFEFALNLNPAFICQRTVLGLNHKSMNIGIEKPSLNIANHEYYSSYYPYWSWPLISEEDRANIEPVLAGKGTTIILKSHGQPSYNPPSNNPPQINSSPPGTHNIARFGV